MTDEEIKILLDKYASGEASEEEIALLESWYLQQRNQENKVYNEADYSQDAAEVWQQLKPAPVISPYRSVILKSLSAAAAILLLFFGAKQLFQREQSSQTTLVAKHSSVIIPAEYRATLTVDGDSIIYLTGTNQKHFLEQGNAMLSQTADDQLQYEQSVAVRTASVSYHTLQTPAAGKYTVTLSDGTKVILNAGSSLRYPAAFSGKERVVELQGEGYFTVVHNERLPFRVTTSGQVIEDIGTSFNVNAYRDEPVVTTSLVEGAAKVIAGSRSAVLKPGQQSRVKTVDQEVSLSVHMPGNFNEELAWIKGLFEFDNAGIKKVMSIASHWYGYQVIYKNNVPDIRITGRISRSTNFKGFMEILQFQGLKYKIDGKNIIVTN